MRKYIVTAPPDRIEAMVAAGRLTEDEAREIYGEDEISEQTYRQSASEAHQTPGPGHRRGPEPGAGQVGLFCRPHLQRRIF